MNKHLDLYTDYLQICFSQATATSLSSMLDGSLSHDVITDLLSKNEFSSKDLWLESKNLVRTHQNENACLIFDDTIVEKPHTDQNEIVSWYYDHKTGKSVKGINILTAFYHTLGQGQEMPLRIPVGYEIIHKNLYYSDLTTKKEIRKSSRTKNEYLQELFVQAINNQLLFKYVLADSWYCSSDNMKFIHKKGKFFIFDIKSNRLACFEKSTKNTVFQRLDQIDLAQNIPTLLYLKDLSIPILLCKQIFKNENGTIGIRYLASNDLNLNAAEFDQIYNKRWSIEEYYKSSKQNTALGKSPTKTIITQKNHVFSSFLAYIKFEKLKFSEKLNHFALKSKLYLAAIKAAYLELSTIKSKKNSLNQA